MVRKLCQVIKLCARNNLFIHGFCQSAAKLNGKRREKMPKSAMHMRPKPHSLLLFYGHIIWKTDFHAKTLKTTLTEVVIALKLLNSPEKQSLVKKVVLHTEKLNYKMSGSFTSRWLNDHTNINQFQQYQAFFITYQRPHTHTQFWVPARNLHSWLNWNNLVHILNKLFLTEKVKNILFSCQKLSSSPGSQNKKNH